MDKIFRYLKKFNNAGSIISIASLVIVTLTANHINVDSNRIMESVKSICSILVILGILNNPTTSGLDLPGKH